MFVFFVTPEKEALVEYGVKPLKSPEPEFLL